ncbi:large conductance mechanosensitive channel protein MscL [Clostridia bacterium OttesenSCG-928-O13]|nr:large conductance mechanosensitive channel protein MscL [Clostridia bacterium OttesenSCG-928-O13]
MKKFLQEFKDFALRGNVMDLAVGVIIGAAFQSVVSSLTDNILSPIIGLFTRQNFDDLKLSLFPDATGVAQVTIKYGAFLTTLINFIIMALVIFLLVRGMNKLASLGSKKEEAAPSTKKCPYCFTDIPSKATRCPNCTAELADAAQAAAPTQ